MATGSVFIAFIIFAAALFIHSATSDGGKCGPEKLEMCAKPLMAWSEDGLAIPKTEEEVVTNCK